MCHREEALAISQRLGRERLPRSVAQPEIQSQLWVFRAFRMEFSLCNAPLPICRLTPLPISSPYLPKAGKSHFSSFHCEGKGWVKRI